MIRTAAAALLALTFGLPATAGDLPVGTAARLVNLISRGAGENGKVACQNAEYTAELAKAGGEASPNARVAWAASADEVRSFALRRKCVVAGDPKLLANGASVAIYDDGGKVRVVLNQKALSGSGVTLSDQILKAAMAQ